MATVNILPFPAFARSIPAADRASLSGLSDAAIREWVVAKAEEYREIALSLLSLHNSIAPIHRALPTELLSEVLSYCWDDMRSVRLMHVCRLWRAIALKTPRLWAEAAAAPGTQFTFNKARIHAQCQDLEENRISFAATAIELSSPAPLRLKIHFLPNALSQTLSSHTSRLVDLFVRLKSVAQLKSLCALLSNGVPNLNVLGIAFPGYTGMNREWLVPGTRTHYDDIDEQGDQRNLSKELTKWSSDVQGRIADTPRLQTLRCVPIDLVSHFACPTVRDMCITPAIFNPHHLEGFVHALMNTPDLTRLDVCMMNRSNVRLRPDDDAPGWTASPVDLPALRTLVVNLDSNMNTAMYLDLISISSSVSINLTQGERGLSYLYHRLRSRHTPFIQAQVRSARTVNICDSHDQWNIPTTVVSTSKDGEQLIRFTFSAGSRGRPGNLESFDFIEIFRHTGAAVTHLVLHQNWEIETPSAQPHVFRAFPHLTSLDLAGPLAHRVITALLHPDVDGNPDALVCPRLGTLKVAFGLNCGDDKSASRKAWAALRARPVGWRETVLRTIPARVAALVKPLEYRAQRGLRLERLEWEDREWDMTLRLEFPPSAVVRTYMPGPALFDQEELEKLVDGPVVFGGFTYQEMVG